MASQIDVENIACAILGVSPVVSTSDTTLQSLTFNSIWNLVRDTELRKHLWKFSITQALISNLYNGTLVAASDSPYTGFSTAGPFGTLTPAIDENQNAFYLMADSTVPSPSFYLNIASSASLGATYLSQITVTGGAINTTLLTSAATYAWTLAGGSSWTWAAPLGLVAGTSYAVRLDSANTNLTQPVTGSYQYAYPLPSNSLRLIVGGDSDFSFPGVDLSDYRSLPTQDDYLLEGGNILTNQASPLSIRYVQQVTNVALWDACFCDAIGARLAHRGCFRITNSLNQQKMAQQEYTQAIQAAMRANALESPPQYIGDDTWVLTRPIGSGGAPTTRIG